MTAGHAVLPHFNGALSRWPLRINPLHDSLCEDHGIRDNRMQRRRWPGALQLTKFASRQNRGHDADHALAALVHDGQSSIIFAFYSPRKDGQCLSRS
jgi:hypothetical protein